MKTDMSWEYAFGEQYKIPGEVISLWEKGKLNDTSWHNDIAPSFTVHGADHDADYVTRLWVEHPNPEMREWGSDAPRFKVTHGEVTHYEGDSIKDALISLWTNAEVVG